MSPSASSCSSSNPGFDEYMAHKTARAVFEVYAQVQERFYERVDRID